MTPREWAEVLSKTRDNDEERQAALMMMADEDWVGEEDAAWLRSVAHRLKPSQHYPDVSSPYNKYYWNELRENIVEKQGSIPDHLHVLIGKVHCDDEPSNFGPFTKNRMFLFDSWLDLLNALKRSGR